MNRELDIFEMIRQVLLPMSLAAALFTLAACGGDDDGSPSTSTPATSPVTSVQDAMPTATPIKHLVILYNENESYDHYFDTYYCAES
jgi:phospholipase C